MTATVTEIELDEHGIWVKFSDGTETGYVTRRVRGVKPELQRLEGLKNDLIGKSLIEVERSGVFGLKL